MRAVVEQNGDNDLPEIKVLITKGKEDLTIKVEREDLVVAVLKVKAWLILSNVLTIVCLR